MRYCAFLILAGLMSVIYGCGSTVETVIDSLSNNTSGDMVRGVKLQTGVDMSSGSPVPSVCFTMGSLARKGKCDRTVMVIDNNTTDIVSESYNVHTVYQAVGTCTLAANNTKQTRYQKQFIKSELRHAKKEQFDEGIFVHQTNSFGMGVTAGSIINAGGSTMIAIGRIGTHTVAASIADSANKYTADSIGSLMGSCTKKIK